MFHFVRDGFIVRMPGLVAWNSSSIRFLDLNHDLISESDCKVSGIGVGSAREVNGIQILFSPVIGSGWDRDFLGRAHRSRPPNTRECAVVYQ
jgi:hypothetical protein